MWNIISRKTNNNRQQTCWWTKYTSEQKCREWSVQCYTLLNPFLWIFGVLNNTFVSGLCGSASLPFYPQLSRFLQYVHASVCRSHAFGRCCMFLKSVLIAFSLSLLQFIFKNSASIFRKLYFLNRFKFLIIALSLLLNGTLHHQYIVGALKYDNIICFWLQTSEMYVKLNII